MMQEFVRTLHLRHTRQETPQPLLIVILILIPLGIRLRRGLRIPI